VVAWGAAHRVQILDSRDDLLEDAVDLWTSHLATHDNTEQVVFAVLHDLVVVTIVRNDIDCLNNVGVMQSRANLYNRSLSSVRAF
jgi:hypothetical protein